MRRYDAVSCVDPPPVHLDPVGQPAAPQQHVDGPADLQRHVDQQRDHDKHVDHAIQTRQEQSLYITNSNHSNMQPMFYTWIKPIFKPMLE